MQVLNDPWPWWGTLRGSPLSVAELVARGTLTPEIAATLWWGISYGASVFVAGGPPGAGKSTVANALLEYVPDNAAVYVTSGARDRLNVPPTDGPLYLLINELSAHMPMYLHGHAVERAFGMLRAGARIVGTLHARSAAEALHVMCDAAELAPRDLQAPFLFVAIDAYRDGPQIVRRVAEVGFLPPSGNLVLLTRASHEGCSLDATALQPLADWSGVSAAESPFNVCAGVFFGSRKATESLFSLCTGVFFGSRKAAAFLPRATRPGPRSRSAADFCAFYARGEVLSSCQVATFITQTSPPGNERVSPNRTGLPPQ